MVIGVEWCVGLLRSMSLPEQRDLVDMFTKSAGVFDFDFDFVSLLCLTI